MLPTEHERAIDSLLRQSNSIPERHPVNLVCCCGRPSCAYLLHNSAALEDLERNVYTAAQLGQALLARHEEYMVEAEKTRVEMGCKIEKLELEKQELETANARTIDDNRELLNQLEDLNSTIATSDTHVKSLESTLQATQQELRRLENLAARTHELERQLATLEQEQISLQSTVRITEADERSAIQRWRKAERGLCDLQDQLERIERESREERERHVEVVGRMERQRAVEKELDTATGRLKSAAAATTLGQSKNGSSVVSHFVKDILQDNANLQLGIVELRELLLNSSDEVEMLREQLMLHQPVTEREARDGDLSGPPTLRAELAPKDASLEVPKEPQVLSQELHIHHHYHAAPKKEEIRRLKKKRNVLAPGLFTPPPGTPSTRSSAASTASAILSHTAVSIPPSIPPNHRWSVQSAQTSSDFAPSSAPSSPQSTHRNPTLFDRGFHDQALDSSRPTSPGSSNDPLSPTFTPYHRKRESEQSMRSFMLNPSFQPGNIIHEEDDDDVDNFHDLGTSIDQAKSFQTPLSDDINVGHSVDDFFSSKAFQPTLRRATSHESILSIAGLDIHTLKARPSQLTITAPSALMRPQGRLLVPSSSTSYVSTTAVTSSATATARPALTHQNHSSTFYLRSSMGLPDRPASRSSGSSAEGAAGLSKKVGGWVWGKWTATPTSSSSGSAGAAVPLTTTAHAAASRMRTPTTNANGARAPPRAVSTPVVAVSEADAMRQYMGRAPGINQKGRVPGLRKTDRVPSMVRPVRVDEEALREVLME